MSLEDTADFLLSNSFLDGRSVLCESPGRIVLQCSTQPYVATTVCGPCILRPPIWANKSYVTDGWS